MFRSNPSPRETFKERKKLPNIQKLVISRVNDPIGIIYSSLLMVRGWTSMENLIIFFWLRASLNWRNIQGEVHPSRKTKNRNTPNKNTPLGRQKIGIHC